MRIGIDTGGTFTDVVVRRGKRCVVDKVPSTPTDPGSAVLHGLARARPAAGRATIDVVHGTTVGLNAILTGRLARTALVTQAGFEDLIEIGRQDRPRLYDLEPRRAHVPVPRSLRFGVTSRRSATGETLATAPARELRALRDRIGAARVDAIAIGLLHSYADASDEHAIADALAPLGVPVTCSADLLPHHGEFERIAAAVLNASIRPIMGSYLERLADDLDAGTELRLLRSNGGVMSAREAVAYPSRAVFSGPAGGVVATTALARRLDVDRLAALDMGGTSTDVSLASPTDDALAGGTWTGASVAGLPLAVPSVDVHTVGCGGGSIAYRDAGGALRVGPQSAGAVPGPACYDLGGDEPTVTDAHVVLGHLGPDTLLGGDFPIDVDRAVRAVERLARSLDMSTRHCAEGILEIADVAMSRALLVITVERSLDPRRVPLAAFGGAGGLHAASLARRLEMPFAVIPTEPGVFSAVGLSVAGASAEATETLLAPLHRGARDGRWLEPIADRLNERALASLESESRPRVRVAARLRYAGQGDGLWLPWSRGRSLATAFAQAHERRFGFTADAPIEVVELRAEARDRTAPLPIAEAADRSAVRNTGPHSIRHSPLRGVPPLARFGRADLRRGQCVDGPALIEERTCVTRVPAGWRARHDEVALRLERSSDRKTQAG